jgi:hypothetical protein
MSVESLHQESLEPRKLRDEEKLLLIALLSNRADFPIFESNIASGRVVDMADGGMGSIRFIVSNDSALGMTLAQAQYFDVDGVPVSIVVNADANGGLYELDFWKADFSSLKEYPRPESLENLSNPGSSL